MKKVGFTDKLQAGYLSIDGSESVSTIKAFQTYVNYHNRSANLPITGVWDEKTEKYVKDLGEDFDKMRVKNQTTIGYLNDLADKQFSHLLVTKGVQKPPMSTGITSKGLSVQVDENGLTVEETKPKMSGKKIGMIIGVVVVVGIIGYVIFKKMKKA